MRRSSLVQYVYHAHHRHTTLVDHLITNSSIYNIVKSTNTFQPHSSCPVATENNSLCQTNTIFPLASCLIFAIIPYILSEFLAYLLSKLERKMYVLMVSERFHYDTTNIWLDKYFIRKIHIFYMKSFNNNK